MRKGQIGLTTSRNKHGEFGRFALLGKEISQFTKPACTMALANTATTCSAPSAEISPVAAVVGGMPDERKVLPIIDAIGIGAEPWPTPGISNVLRVTVIFLSDVKLPESPGVP